MAINVTTNLMEILYVTSFGGHDSGSHTPGSTVSSSSAKDNKRTVANKKSAVFDQIQVVGWSR